MMWGWITYVATFGLLTIVTLYTGEYSAGVTFNLIGSLGIFCLFSYELIRNRLVRDHLGTGKDGGRE